MKRVENNLNIMSWNVKGLNNPIKKNKILSFIKSKKCDIAFVQETHLLPQDSQTLCVGWVGYVGAASGTSKSRGVATLIGKHLQFKCIQKSKDDAGRMMLMLCEVQGKAVILANVYAPNVDDPSFFGQLEKKISDMGDYPIIMGGDFNEVMDPVLDRSSRSVYASRAHRALKGLTEASIKETGLHDLMQLILGIS
uniref:exodeoxyribonuclease III n=1 Tax=Maylandia zebra TaxID=106582 RepID=A0A3P9DB37_9CICH